MKSSYIPDGCQIEESEQSLKITFAERIWGYLIWIFVGAVFTLLGVVTISDPDTSAPFILPIGIVIIYMGLVKLINHNEIVVTSNTLSIHSIPLPILGNKTMGSTQISEIFVTEIDDDKEPWNYQLNILLRDGRTVRLAKTVSSSTVEFIKQRIEQWLGIQNQAVVDKTSRTNKGRLTG